jgi:hypothetical protein
LASDPSALRLRAVVDKNGCRGQLLAEAVEELG